MPVQVRCTIRPPHRSSLSQSNLRSIDLLPGLLPATLVSISHRNPLRTTCRHKQRGPMLFFVGRQVRIGAAPEPATHNEVPSIRRDWVNAHSREWMGRGMQFSPVLTDSIVTTPSGKPAYRLAQLHSQSAGSSTSSAFPRRFMHEAQAANNLIRANDMHVREGLLPNSS